MVSARGVVLVEGHEVGRIDGFNFHPDPATQGQEKKLVLRAARRALGQEMPRRILRAELAPDTEFSISPTQRIVWEGAEIARLRKGASIMRPAVEILPSEFIDGAARERLRIRLAAYMAASVDTKLAPLAAVMAAPPPTLRGVVHRLGEALGVLPGEIGTPAEKAALKPLGIVAGRFALFMPALLKPNAAAMRALLWALWNGVETPRLPPAGLVSIPASSNPDFAFMMGWLPAGPVMLRLDIAEKLGGELHYLIRKQPVVLPANLASRMSLKPEHLPTVLNILGLRIIPAATLGPKFFGPPTPPLLARRKHVAMKAAAPPPPPPEPLPDSPFAALAALRRNAS
ncbi:MAG: hypothetical protein B7W99_01040 [Rhodospirillales bacterium 20-58-10]|nr:MAG: hypothetical protein B7W99_01040 [Rhodospirillales bacterium 20-58-10]